MRIRKLIINITLHFFSLFLIFMKKDPNKITFISLESDTLSGDFKLLSDQLEKKEMYHLHYILVKFEKSLKGNWDYFVSCIHQLFAVNTSRLVILDYNNYVVSNFKRPYVKVLQLWHASGAIKKFGNDVSRDYEISSYDYVICNSDYYIKPFASAFGVNEDQIIATGIPKTDRLFNTRKIEKDKKWMYDQFPQIKGKKVVFYAPTFRGKIMRKGGNVAIDFDLDFIADKLGEDYVVLYKMHPLLSDCVMASSNQVICCNNMSIKKLFSVCDYLISDYSAITIDFSVFEKPMIFYTPDLEEYRKEIGFYVDYEKMMPGPICYSKDEVLDAIVKDEFDIGKIKEFKNLMFKYQDGKSCKRVVSLIESIMKGGF